MCIYCPEVTLWGWHNIKIQSQTNYFVICATVTVICVVCAIVTGFCRLSNCNCSFCHLSNCHWFLLRAVGQKRLVPFISDFDLISNYFILLGIGNVSLHAIFMTVDFVKLVYHWSWHLFVPGSGCHLTTLSFICIRCCNCSEQRGEDKWTFTE